MTATATQVQCYFSEQICGAAVALGILDNVLVTPSTEGVVTVGDYYGEWAHEVCDTFSADHGDATWSDGERAEWYIPEPTDDQLRELFG